MNFNRPSLISLVVGCTGLIGTAIHAQAPNELQQQLQKNACLGCHGIDKKMVGPAFKDVAAKYRNDTKAEAKLIAKIKAGGSGVWGAIPMPPQSLKEEDVKVLVKQILLLK